jgi:DNA-binding response OmpR family regulator
VSKRVLLVEPDDTARALMSRVLIAEGLRIVGVRSLADVAPDAAFDLAIVDELAGDGAILAEVKRVQARYPALPLIVTGALMTPGVLVDVLRLGAIDALPKPFTPAELRAAAQRVVLRMSVGHDQAVAFASAIAAARDAIARETKGLAKAPLAVAQAASPFDAEAMALLSLLAELDGRDEAAGRGYRAALALGRDEDLAGPHPLEGLARLALYRDAVPVDRFPKELVGAPARIASDVEDLEHLDSSEVTVLLLGVSPDATAAYFRVSPERAFVLLAASGRPETVAAALDRIGIGRVSRVEGSAAPLDVERIERLRKPIATPSRASGS